MSVHIVRSFIDANEASSYARHFLSVPEQFSIGIDLTKQDLKARGRMTNRISGAQRIHYPPFVYALRARIRGHGIEFPIYDEGHGKDGVVVVITSPGGDTYHHIDPQPKFSGGHVLRCNLLVAGSGPVIVSGVQHEFNTGDLMCFVVSKHYHSVPTVHETRINMLFGFAVPMTYEPKPPQSLPNT